MNCDKILNFYFFLIGQPRLIGEHLLQIERQMKQPDGQVNVLSFFQCFILKILIRFIYIPILMISSKKVCKFSLDLHKYGTII